MPGVAAGPVLLVRGEVSPDAIARFGDGDFADADAALAAYDDAAGAVAETFTAKAASAQGAAAEVLTASAGLARDKGLRGAVAKNLQAGQGPVAAVQGAVDQFVTIFTTMGGLMAERVTDLRDIERRVVAAPRRRAGARRARRRASRRSSSPRTSRRATPPASTRRW